MAQQAAPSTVATPVPDHDYMPLNGIHHVELYVGNALQAAYYYAHAFGFSASPTAAWRPARATRSPTCFSRAASAWSSPARWTPARRSPPTSTSTATGSRSSP